MANLKQAERGNAIIWIFIAVGLFAALSYTFVQSSRTSTSVITDAQAQVYAQETIAYGNELKQAVKRLLLRGCSDTEISFENNVLGQYNNPNSPVNKRCHVFDKNGGGMRYNPPESIFSGPSENFYSSVVNGVSVTGNGNDCADSSCTELVLVIRLSSNSSSSSDMRNARRMCLKINEILSLNLAAIDVQWGDDTPSGSNYHRFKGTYNTDILINDPNINGKKAYCGKIGAGEIYSFHTVLLAR